jgi:hypothetical protein
MTALLSLHLARDMLARPRRERDDWELTRYLLEATGWEVMQFARGGRRRRKPGDPVWGRWTTIPRLLWDEGDMLHFVRAALPQHIIKVAIYPDSEMPVDVSITPPDGGRVALAWADNVCQGLTLAFVDTLLAQHKAQAGAA